MHLLEVGVLYILMQEMIRVIPMIPSLFRPVVTWLDRKSRAPAMLVGTTLVVLDDDWMFPTGLPISSTTDMQVMSAMNLLGYLLPSPHGNHALIGKNPCK